MVLAYWLVASIFTLRSWTGPLPELACDLTLKLTTFLSFNFCLMTVAATGVRFVFAFAFKSIPTIDDDLFATFINIFTTMWTFLVASAKFFLDERIYLAKRLCTGTWSVTDLTKRSLPVAAIFYVGCWLVHVLMSIAIMFKWHKIEQKAQSSQNNLQITSKSNLASMTSTIVSTGLLLIVGSDLAYLNR